MLQWATSKLSAAESLLTSEYHVIFLTFSEIFIIFCPWPAWSVSCISSPQSPFLRQSSQITECINCSTCHPIPYDVIWSIPKWHNFGLSMLTKILQAYYLLLAYKRFTSSCKLTNRAAFLSRISNSVLHEMALLSVCPMPILCQRRS